MSDNQVFRLAICELAEIVRETDTLEEAKRVVAYLERILNADARITTD